MNGYRYNVWLKLISLFIFSNLKGPFILVLWIRNSLYSPLYVLLPTWPFYEYTNISCIIQLLHWHIILISSKHYCESFTCVDTIYGKTSMGVNFVGALLIGNVSLQNCYCERFTMNSYVPPKTWKFSPADVILWMRVTTYLMYVICRRECCIHVKSKQMMVAMSSCK